MDSTGSAQQDDAVTFGGQLELVMPLAYSVCDSRAWRAYNRTQGHEIGIASIRVDPRCISGVSGDIRGMLVAWGVP